MSEQKTRVIADKYELPLGESPVIRLKLSNETLKMDYDNTTIRRFEGDYEAISHIEYVRDDGRLLGVSLTTISEGLLETLEDLKYPTETRPIPRQSDLDWYGALLAVRKEVDISAIYAEPIKPRGALQPENTEPVPLMSLQELGGLMIVCAAEQVMERLTRPLTSPVPNPNLLN